MTKKATMATATAITRITIPVTTPGDKVDELSVTGGGELDGTMLEEVLDDTKELLEREVLELITGEEEDPMGTELGLMIIDVEMIGGCALDVTGGGSTEVTLDI
jgi:hypothetical protein